MRGYCLLGLRKWWVVANKVLGFGVGHIGGLFSRGKHTDNRFCLTHPTAHGQFARVGWGQIRLVELKPASGIAWCFASNHGDVVANADPPSPRGFIMRGCCFVGAPKWWVVANKVLGFRVCHFGGLFPRGKQTDKGLLGPTTAHGKFARVGWVKFAWLAANLRAALLGVSLQITVTLSRMPTHHHPGGLLWGVVVCWGSEMVGRRKQGLGFRVGHIGVLFSRDEHPDNRCLLDPPYSVRQICTPSFSLCVIPICT